MNIEALFGLGIVIIWFLAIIIWGYFKGKQIDKERTKND